MTEKLRYAEFRGPFGPIFVATTHKGIWRVSLGDVSRWEFLEQLRGGCEEEPVEDKARFRRLLNDLKAYFSGEPVNLNYTVDLTGASDFQRKVLLTTKRIPYGETRAYKEIAEAIGKPRAYRAVGQALGANPIPLIIPCHRVIGSDGGLGGFGGGLKMKKWLLRLEGAL